jgi:nitrogen fixation/metabolism regulation signal transduction histidine kinase
VRIEAARGRGRYADTVELRLQDNGPGFADDIMTQLFEPYVTTKPRGTGLGLPIVKKIVEEHNGQISARNIEGGAQVTVRLPVPGRGERRPRMLASAGGESRS